MGSPQVAPLSGRAFTVEAVCGYRAGRPEYSPGAGSVGSLAGWRKSLVNSTQWKSRPWGAALLNSYVLREITTRDL